MKQRTDPGYNKKYRPAPPVSVLLRVAAACLPPLLAAPAATHGAQINSASLLPAPVSRPAAAESASVALAQQQRPLYARRSATLAIRDVTYARQPVSLFGKLEIGFQARRRLAQPLRSGPDRCRGDADRPFRQADGDARLLPHPLPLEERPDAVGKRRRLCAGRPGAVERAFRAPEPGAWTFVLRARDAAGKTAQAGPFTFEVEPAAHPGFVRVSRGNPTTSRTPATAPRSTPPGPISPGRGARTPCRAKARPMNTTSAAPGATSPRRAWACHWAWLEWMPPASAKPDTAYHHYAGIGYYNPMISSAFDRIFDMAERQNLRIMLVTDDNNEPVPRAGRRQAGLRRLGVQRLQRRQRRPARAPPRCSRTRRHAAGTGTGCATSMPAGATGLLMGHQHLERQLHSRPPPAFLGQGDARLRAHHGGRLPALLFGTNYHYGAQAISDYAQAEREIVPGKPNVTQEAYYTREREWVSARHARGDVEGLLPGQRRHPDMAA